MRGLDMTNLFASEIDLGLASEVQQMLFPKSMPVCRWCCMGVKNRMARGLGGDYFELIDLPDGCQVVFLGDVTGHGVQASVVMALLYGFLHRAARTGCEPGETVAQVNEFLFSFARRSHKLDHFFSTTLFYGVINPVTFEMRYVNAGQVTPLVRRGRRLLRLASTAQPLGYFSRPEIDMDTFLFEPHDRLLLVTDGIVESFNDRQEVFGGERVAQLLLKHPGGHRDFLEELFRALAEFGASDPPEDDCTAITIDFRQPET
jgi:serine phosphatase RsbU (regulator of sigma subunit)